jgi:hypothetical protein
MLQPAELQGQLRLFFQQRIGRDAMFASQLLEGCQTPFDRIAALRIQIERIQIVLQRMTGLGDADQCLIQHRRQRIELRIQMTRLPQR